MQPIAIHSNDTIYPQQCRRMTRPPDPLFILGNTFDALMNRARVAIIGSRRMSGYGQQVTRQMAGELAAHGVVIVSGLALGVDAVAHQAALDAGGHTIAVLPSPVQQPLPAANYQLAQRIAKQGGALVSSYPDGETPHKGNFVARNEIVAAISDLVVVTEAGEHSGTWHTAEFARDLGVPVMSVPTNITNRYGAGSNRLLSVDWARAAIDVASILQELGLTASTKSVPQGGTANEQLLLDLLSDGVIDGSELMLQSGLGTAAYNQALSMLEIGGTVKALGGDRWGLH